mgnify:CR=1 FL=1
MTKGNTEAKDVLIKKEKIAEREIEEIGVGNSYKVIPWQMGIVAKLLRLLPNFLYDFIFSKAPHKSRVNK